MKKIKNFLTRLRKYFARRRNKTFYITFISQILVGAQIILKATDHGDLLTDAIQHTILSDTNIVLTILATLGVLNNPTTPGVTDDNVEGESN